MRLTRRSTTETVRKEPGPWSPSPTPWRNTPASPFGAAPASTPKPPRSVHRSVSFPAGLMASAAAATFAGALALSGALAAPSVTDLGRPMDVVSTDAYLPLSGFHLMRDNVQQHGKPELIFMGAMGPMYTAINAERWPVVRALDQFGTLKNVRAVDHACHPGPARESDGKPICTNPTFDFSHARYTSKYLTFASVDLIRYTGGDAPVRFQKMSPVEAHLYDKYVRYKGKPVCARRLPSGQYRSYHCRAFVDYVSAAISYPNSARTLPLVAIGHYLQTVSQVTQSSDFSSTVAVASTPAPNGQIPSGGYSSGLSFTVVQEALISGHDPPLTHLVEDVNAEANIMTAIICHADHNRPGKVCHRAAIKQILKHVG